jgi:hypothetical protein
MLMICVGDTILRMNEHRNGVNAAVEADCFYLESQLNSLVNEDLYLYSKGKVVPVRL